MPELFEKVEETKIDIRNIQGYVIEVRRLQSLILSSTSADNSLKRFFSSFSLKKTLHVKCFYQIDKELNEELESQIAEITVLCDKVRQQLKGN